MAHRSEQPQAEFCKLSGVHRPSKPAPLTPAFAFLRTGGVSVPADGELWPLLPAWSDFRCNPLQSIGNDET